LRSPDPSARLSGLIAQTDSAKSQFGPGSLHLRRPLAASMIGAIFMW